MLGELAGGGNAGEVWVIEPRSPNIAARLREIWKYRHLLSYFARQAFWEIFRESRLGLLWLTLRAGLPTLITGFVFGEVAQFSSGDVPYILFLLVGMVCWHLFEYSLLWATRSMNKFSKLLTRMYFPRILVLPASTMQGVVMTAILLVLTIATLVYLWITSGRVYLVVGPSLALAPVALAVSWLMALAMALWTSVLDAPARDVRYTLRYILRFWFFLTPIAYPLSEVPERWRWLVSLNPMTAPVEAFRAGLLGSGELNAITIASTVVTLLVVGVGGLFFFGRAEATMADRL